MYIIVSEDLNNNHLILGKIIKILLNKIINLLTLYMQLVDFHNALILNKKIMININLAINNRKIIYLKFKKLQNLFNKTIINIILGIHKIKILILLINHKLIVLPQIKL